MRQLRLVKKGVQHLQRQTESGTKKNRWRETVLETDQESVTYRGECTSCLIVSLGKALMADSRASSHALLTTGNKIQTLTFGLCTGKKRRYTCYYLCLCGSGAAGRSSGWSMCGCGSGLCHLAGWLKMTLLLQAGFLLQIHSGPPEWDRQDRLTLWHTFLRTQSVNDATYADFWHNPTKCLSWILADQTWQVADDTGSLDLLTHTDDN